MKKDLEINRGYGKKAFYTTSSGSKTYCTATCKKLQKRLNIKLHRLK